MTHQRPSRLPLLTKPKEINACFDTDGKWCGLMLIFVS
jgi:hypothetical protein